MTDIATPAWTPTQRLTALAALLLSGFAAASAGSDPDAFLAGLALAYLWDPAVDRLERAGMGRTLGVCLVFLLMSLLVVLALLVLVPLLGRQMHVLATKVPPTIEWFRTAPLPWLQGQFNIAEGDIPLERIKQALIENWQSAGGFAQGLLVSATSSSLALLGWVANLVLIPVVTFYLLRDWDVMVANIRETLPRAWESTVASLARECDEVVSAFLRGQLLVMLALSVCYTVGLMLVGLDLALLIGMLAGLASIVPYLGLLIGIVAASIAALVQFGDWVPLVYVVVVFVLSQMLEGMYLTPKLVGDRIGLHPVVVIFAVMAGGQLFGFTGVLLALPVSAVIMVLLRHLHQRYRASQFYGPAGLAMTAPQACDAVSEPVTQPSQDAAQQPCPDKPAADPRETDAPRAEGG
jgi:predicted PurR-regulated permease PerM